MKIFVHILVIFLINLPLTAEERIEIGIEEKLGSYLPGEAFFKDENGNQVRLSDLVTSPTVFTFVYYDCPGLCSPLLFELSNVVSKSDLEPGYDYNLISISIDENDTPEIAFGKKKELFSAIEKDISEESWRFLTGDITNVKLVTDAAGFYFKREGDEFRHAGALIFVDKNLKICRYLFPGYTENHGYGILPFDFKMAILETSSGKEIPTIARALRFCFSYDTEGQKYTLNFTRIFGIVIILFAGFFVLIVVLKPRKDSIKSR